MNHRLLTRQIAELPNDSALVFMDAQEFRCPLLLQRDGAALMRGCAVTLVILLGAAISWADVEVPMKHHDWGRFSPGAWQQVSIVTETLDENGKVTATTTTEKLTTLVRVTRRSVSLRVENKVEVGGKSFDGPEQVLALASHGEELGQETTSKDLGIRETKVAGRTVSCRVQQYQIKNKDDSKLLRIYYSADVSPYVLKRESVTTRVRGDKRTTYQTNLEVVEVNVPEQVLDLPMKVTKFRKTQKNGKSATEMVASHAKSVPGGIIAYTSVETNTEGRVVRRSRMELVDYDLSDGSDDQAGFKNRRRARRAWRRAAR